MASLLTEFGHEVVGVAGDAAAVVALALAHRPDVAVLDIRMPPDHTDDGARAAAELRLRAPAIGVLLLSQHIETRLAVDLVRGGRFGYLLKDRVLAVDDFIDALERITAGGSALDTEVVARILAARSDALAALTAREHEVLGLMAEGLTNSGIAERLVLTARTVESHVGSILLKLGLSGSDPAEHRRVRAVLAYLNQKDR